MSSGYTLPAGNAVHFEFRDASGYTPQLGSATHFTRVVYRGVDGADFLAFGLSALANLTTGGAQYVTLDGTDFCVVWNEFGPYDSLGRREGFRHYNAPIVVTGFDTLSFGTPTVT